MLPTITGTSPMAWKYKKVLQQIAAALSLSECVESRHLGRFFGVLQNRMILIWRISF
jgi:hypothetical protein